MTEPLPNRGAAIAAGGKTLTGGCCGIIGLLVIGLLLFAVLTTLF